jgi:hypothetical protein
VLLQSRRPGRNAGAALGALLTIQGAQDAEK